MEGNLIVKEYRPNVNEFNEPAVLLGNILSDPECQSVGIAKVCIFLYKY